MNDDSPKLEPDSPPGRRAVKRASNTKRGRLTTAIGECFVEMSFSPFLKFLSKESRAIKAGWHVFAGILVVAIVVAIMMCRWHYVPKVEDLTVANEKLANERDRAKQDLAPWVTLANSHFTNTPLTKRLDALFDSISDMQNASPILDLYINNQKISHMDVFNLPTNRVLKLVVRNMSPITAEGISVASYWPESQRSNIFSEHWIRESTTLPAANGSFVDDKEKFALNLTASGGISESGAWNTPPITLSTNFPAGVYRVQFDTFAHRSRRRVFFVMLNVSGLDPYGTNISPIPTP